MVELYCNVCMMLQEGGVNMLFLVFGFLIWNCVDKEDVKYCVLLIFILVGFNWCSVWFGFMMMLYDDELRFNLMFIEMFCQDFQFNLNIVEGELFCDEVGLDIVKIWKVVFVVVKDIKGWEVFEEVVFLIFFFVKYLMWVDLVQCMDQLCLNFVVKYFIDIFCDFYLNGIVFLNFKVFDKDYGFEKIFCLLLLDLLQLFVVMVVVCGKDFVFIGLLGIGKS